MNIYEVIGCLVVNQGLCENVFAEIGSHSDKIILDGVEDEDLAKSELNKIKMKLTILQAYVLEYQAAVDSLLDENSHNVIRESLIKSGFTQKENGNLSYEIIGSKTGTRYVISIDPEEMIVHAEAYHSSDDPLIFKNLSELALRIKEIDNSEDTIESISKIIDNIASTFKEVYN